MATPHVSGVAALLKSYNPAWTWAEVKARILDGVEQLSSLNDKILTEGRINAYNSLVYEPVTLEVTSPTASTVWYKNEAVQITWTKSGTQDANVKIQLYKGANKVKDISLSTPNDGSTDWTVPKGLTASSNYRVRIRTADNEVEDYSDTFTIAKPSIVVTSPAAGVTWGKSTTHDILWTVNGTMDANVKIHLMRGTTVVQTIVGSTANSGSYSWTIPDSLTARSDYKVRVKTIDNAVNGKSGKFAIS
jgi:5-hydroxyisourate hydrolase-like protein (transthyretin family)